MADREPGDEQPSLELPKLGWRRTKAQKPSAPEAPAPEAEDTRPVALIEPAPEPTHEPVAAPREPRPPRGPGGLLAATVVGLIVGLGLVGLTWASLQGCEAAQGTSSCGQAGYPILGVILVVMVIVGALLLRLARVAEPGSTSFLGVGLTAVLALLLLVDSLENTSMIVVIPLIDAACFAAAHWVTSTFIGPAPD